MSGLVQALNHLLAERNHKPNHLWPTWLPKMPIAQTDLVGLSNYHLWKSEIAQAKYEAMWKHGFGPESTEGDYETHQAILGAESNHDYTLLVRGKVCKLWYQHHNVFVLPQVPCSASVDVSGSLVVNKKGTVVTFPLGDTSSGLLWKTSR